ncbi:MAG TPA: DUF1684 domain-containing protein [Thermoanaerobaculia bacterium]|nr:DUF1684 domain-containing protein [Thermoanaerobaculia bacterium]
MMRTALLVFLAVAAIAPSYDAEVKEWREHRRASLLKDDGWLTLTGLYWLHEGSNDIELPTHPPSHVDFVLRDGHVSIDKEVLRDDMDPKGPTVIRNGSVDYQAIKRVDNGVDKFGIRVKDTQSEARKDFKGLDYFPTNPAYRVEARFELYNPPHKITITNVLGMTSDETSPGALVFTLQGKTFRLDPIWDMSDPEPRDLFIIFRDQTSGRETYAAARYLYAKPPGKDGRTIVDFNKSYNPPCVFTHFATCPLPPQQNRLPIRVEAGEKKYAGHA